MKKKIFLYIGLAFQHYLAASQEFKPESSNFIFLSNEQIIEAQIETLKASPSILQKTFGAPAQIVINEQQQAIIVARVSGVVSDISKNVGDYVSKGETLAVLQSRPMAAFKAAYLTLLKRSSLAQQTFEAEAILKEKKVTSEQAYLQALLIAEEASIKQELAEQQLYLLGMSKKDVKQLTQEENYDLFSYQIKSSLNGVITSKIINIGSLLNADQEAFKIADLDTVWVQIGVYAQDLPYLKLGDKVQVALLNEEKFSDVAEIIYLSPILDKQTRSGTAIALLANPSRKWYPGSYVRVEVIAEEVEVPIAVLKEAVQVIEGKTFLFIAHSQGFEKCEVEIGRADHTYVEILSGIKQGTPYAATHAFILKAEDGKKAIKND
ncbi:efflux RND transporter periplasmic adaptor subunit [Neochlamydia sp. AcF95]|uniref:efflux RND transporter periplasmic adaptor subunit n=1 Tax=Neochlamydia sp. AcF95 TaxID=2795734 RepID=UPI001BCA066F|nr:efflux RND transporter periplasmic adaptor subunit [Neochlamydia sp. AcF95]